VVVQVMAWLLQQHQKTTTSKAGAREKMSDILLQKEDRNNNH